MTDHNIVRMVHAIEERISGGAAADMNSGGGVQASVDGTFLADVISVNIALSDTQIEILIEAAVKQMKIQENAGIVIEATDDVEV